jgi:hypothetical protein
MRRTRIRIPGQERPEEPRVARRQAEAGPFWDPGPVAAEVLRLQRSGGNQAVGLLLARQTDNADKADAADAQDRPVTATLIMPDPIGVLPVENYRFGSRPDEFIVTVPSTAQDPKLFEYAAKGIRLGSVKLSTGHGLTVTITDAVIGSVAGTGSIQLTLNGKIEPTFADKK